LRKSNKKDGSILISVPNGFNKQTPLWMTEQRASCYRIAEKAEICLKAFFSLIELLECSEEDENF